MKFKPYHLMTTRDKLIMRASAYMRSIGSDLNERSAHECIEYVMCLDTDMTRYYRGLTDRSLALLIKAVMADVAHIRKYSN